VIRTDDLLLRPFESGDLEWFAPLVADPVTMAHYPRPFDPSMARWWVDRQLDPDRPAGVERRVVVLKETGEPIGDAGVLHLELVGKQRNDLGWILDHRFHGHGFGTQAAAAMRDHAFASGLDDLWANMATDHHASRRVAEKIGMQLVTTFTNARNRNKETLLFGLRADGRAPDV